MRSTLARDAVSRGGLIYRPHGRSLAGILRPSAGTVIRNGSRSCYSRRNLNWRGRSRRCSRALTAAVRWWKLLWWKLLFGQLTLTFLFRFDCLLLHERDGVEMVFDVLVFAAFHRAVRSMHGAAKVFHENGVDPQHGVLVALRLKHVAHSQRSDVAGILKVPGVERLQPDFIKNLAT